MDVFIEKYNLSNENIEKLKNCENIKNVDNDLNINWIKLFPIEVSIFFTLIKIKM